MEGKLIKINNIYTLMVNDKMIASDDEDFQIDYDINKLSLKNCEAIANGYDFDEYQEGIFYAGNFGHPSPEGFSDEQVGRLHGFIDGFQKALEILSDKKYTETELYRAFLINSDGNNTTLRNFFEQTVLPMFNDNEWDVEICCYIGNGDKESDSFKDPIVTNTGIPKLDADGCLILRRI